MTQRPLCFVLMPFGSKPGGQGQMIDFDAVYRDYLEPAIEAADLEPIRADEEVVGGLIHKPMFERLLLCDYAVADLTTANANVFYELGVRHAVRPYATVLVFAEGFGRLPFDVAPLRGLPYRLGRDGRLADPARDKAALTQRLHDARERQPDSPLYQLLTDYPNVAREKTDVFRRQVDAAAGVKRRLADARRDGADAVRAVEGALGALVDAEAGVVVDLFLSYRAVEAFEDMVRLEAAMSKPLRRTTLVREQLGFALNRIGDGATAETVLKRLIEDRGPSSETYGILGRVYKDRWEAAAKAGETLRATGDLVQAIEAYRRGFEADMRDAYPGINAVTLMELKDPPDPERARLLPVVRYAVDLRIAKGQPDYWDWATLAELAVLQRDEAGATAAAGRALAVVRETWEPKTTARNLRLIREARTGRGDHPPWADGIEAALVQAAQATP